MVSAECIADEMSSRAEPAEALSRPLDLGLSYLRLAASWSIRFICRLSIHRSYTGRPFLRPEMAEVPVNRSGGQDDGEWHRAGET